MNSFVTVAAWPARIFSQNAGTLFELQNAALVGMWHAEQRVLLHTGLVFEDLRVAARVAVVDQRLRRDVERVLDQLQPLARGDGLDVGFALGGRFASRFDLNDSQHST